MTYLLKPFGIDHSLTTTFEGITFFVFAGFNLVLKLICATKGCSNDNYKRFYIFTWGLMSLGMIKLTWEAIKVRRTGIPKGPTDGYLSARSRALISGTLTSLSATSTWDIHVANNDYDAMLLECLYGCNVAPKDPIDVNFAAVDEYFRTILRNPKVFLAILALYGVVTGFFLYDLKTHFD